MAAILQVKDACVAQGVHHQMNQEHFPVGEVVVVAGTQQDVICSREPQRQDQQQHHVRRGAGNNAFHHSHNGRKIWDCAHEID
eukprot:scaffold641424_cov11-Prasinocladus_malaysianus.AAC.1